EPYTPGLSIEEIKERYGLSRVVKLASNENPLGVSPVVRKALETTAPLSFRYPQASSPKLAEALAGYLDVEPECIVTGNGSDELIDLLIRVKARPGIDNIVAFEPCFSLYKSQAKLCGVEFRQTPLNKDFSFPWEKLVDLTDQNTALCFVTAPDNPSGRMPEPKELANLAQKLPEQCLLVVDEAYIDFVSPNEGSSLLPRIGSFPNLVILRTFSKMFGLAGLRLGYGIMRPWLAEYLLRVKPPFSVNILAEQAGIAALRDKDFYRATRETVLKGRETLEHGLTALGCEVYPSQANFLMFDLPKDSLDADRFFTALLEKGIIIRPLVSYGLPNLFRVTVGDKSENKEFLAATKEILSLGK
ncbi:MAG: histidinol-phosphate transaminase, partial [Thermodesulfobacteriota bacterium]|nr:histidinol-phosphate transaminase [Thermodesulfobacteriota bacterium]